MLSKDRARYRSIMRCNGHDLHCATKQENMGAAQSFLLNRYHEETVKIEQNPYTKQGVRKCHGKGECLWACEEYWLLTYSLRLIKRSEESDG